MPCYIEQVPLHSVALVLIGLGVLAWLVNFAGGGPVSRVRLERFARRQRLTITAENGNRVIAYLTAVRRWRAAGVIAGVVGSLVWSLTQNGVSLNVLTLFAGCFAGALIAEVGLARVPSGPPRAAAATSTWSVRRAQPLAAA